MTEKKSNLEKAKEGSLAAAKEANLAVAKTIWGREPALILALVGAVISLVISFGFNLMPEQIGAIMALTSIVLGVVTRSQVSPS